MAKTKNVAAKRAEGEIVQHSSSATLDEYRNHFQRFGTKKNSEQEAEILLEVAKDDLSEADYQVLEAEVAPKRALKRARKIARSEAVEQGLTRADLRKAQELRAVEAGVWHLKYPEGCTDCSKTDRKHYSGGRCTRCYTAGRNNKMASGA